jgi:hypothetical protein
MPRKTAKSTTTKATTPRTVNKSAFVRSLPATMPAVEVVKVAATKGIKLGEKFVHTIRYNAKKAAAKKTGGAPSSLAVPQRGPGRPRKVVAAGGGGSPGLAAEIEKIVEAKVKAILTEKLGKLFAR